jgi:ABC-type uncharacterized transport system permease subunit
MTSPPWRPSKPACYFLAVLTIWPIVYFALFMSFIVFSFASIGSSAAKNPTLDLFKFVVPLHILTILLMFALTAVYVVHAFRNDELASDRRILWVIVLLLGGMIASPVYWWFYLRPSRPIDVERLHAAPSSSG